MPSFTDTIEKTNETAFTPVQPFPQPLVYLTRCSLRYGGWGDGVGWQLMAQVLMLARAGWLPSPSQCDTLMTRVSLHAHGTPLASVYFSHLWDCRLNTWHWKDWQFPDRLGGRPRWVLNQQCQQREKTCKPGRFPNYLPTRGNCLFSTYLPKSPFMSSIYHFKQASWQRYGIEDKMMTN